jgi:hypothetical protein
MSWSRLSYTRARCLLNLAGGEQVIAGGLAAGGARALGDEAKFTMMIRGTMVTRYLENLESVVLRVVTLRRPIRLRDCWRPRQEPLPPRPLLHLLGAPQQDL